MPDPGKAPLAGNSVGTDKAFLDRDMAELVAYLHYRVIDVSSIKELARRWYPRVYFASPRKNGGHRALADILESIDELRYYRAALLPAAAGSRLGDGEEDRRGGRRDVGQGVAARVGRAGLATSLSGRARARGSRRRGHRGHRRGSPGERRRAPTRWSTPDAMGWLTGLEPATPWTTTRCSTT